jgi:hypothetical protein
MQIKMKIKNQIQLEFYNSYRVFSYSRTYGNKLRWDQVPQNEQTSQEQNDSDGTNHREDIKRSG